MDAKFSVPVSCNRDLVCHAHAQHMHSTCTCAWGAWCPLFRLADHIDVIPQEPTPRPTSAYPLKLSSCPHSAQPSLQALFTPQLPFSSTLKHPFRRSNPIQTQTITMFRQQIARQARLFSTTPVARKSPVEVIKDAAKKVDQTISGAAVKGIEKGGTYSPAVDSTRCSVVFT